MIGKIVKTIKKKFQPDFQDNNFPSKMVFRSAMLRDHWIFAGFLNMFWLFAGFLNIY